MHTHDEEQSQNQLEMRPQRVWDTEIYNFTYFL